MRFAITSASLLVCIAGCTCESPPAHRDAAVDARADVSAFDVRVASDVGASLDAATPVRCASNDDCSSDTRCEGEVCVPWEPPPGVTHDESCLLDVNIEAIEPNVQCAWEGPPPGDAHPTYTHVLGTPVVVDFDFDNNPRTLHPSIVFTTYPNTPLAYNGPGFLRVIDGATCEQQWSVTLATEATAGASTAALGDLNGDGRAEIVAPRAGGGLIAFRWDTASRTFVRMWTSATCTGATRTAELSGTGTLWSAPAIHDLNDDGVPEIVHGATVYRSDGCALFTAPFPTEVGASTFAAYNRGVLPVIADVDEDGKMELIQANALSEWRGSGWVPEPTFRTTGLGLGNVAVAELGSFPGRSGVDHAEIVVAGNGFVRVQTVEGDTVFGPIAIPGGGLGGPPTIADFDGDGRAEFASAGGSQYVVFDLDCLDGPDRTGCGSGRTDGILWTMPSRDLSSNVTGSSVFDFDADGAAEAVYADECFLRIYDGATGSVLFSAARSSGTAYENPVIVDVDGDFHTEIVTAANAHSETTVAACAGEDPLTPGSVFSASSGILVLRDVMDRWAGSRPVWNQHAYSVTHVGDHGEIPATSAVTPNWRDPTLNNFRQNVQGHFDALGLADLTTTAIGPRLRVPCDAAGRATLEARVCNRGSAPMASGFVVEFRNGSPTGAALCRVTSPTFLEIGMCEEANCEATLPLDRAIDVFVVADPDATERECFERNNTGLQPSVACDTID